MSSHIATHHGIFGSGGHTDRPSEGKPHLNWQRVVFVVFMTVLFLVLFVFL